MSTVAQNREPQPARQSKVPPNLVLRCVVYPNKPNEYTGECVDLDIMARGDTPQKAFDTLKQAVTGYLQVAFKDDLHGLVPRPSPWSHRARYHLYALRAALSIGIRRKFLVSDWSPDLSGC